jgi:hypothetical protein
METQVRPYLGSNRNRPTKPNLTQMGPNLNSSKHLVNTLGDSTTEIFNRAHTIALETCPTKKTTPSTQHLQKRQTSRLRNKYLRLRRHLENHPPLHPLHSLPAHPLP